MIKVEANWIDLRYLDDLAAKNTAVHRLDPCAKIVTTLAFIVAVTSFPKYELISLLPFFFYPVALISLGELPPAPLVKRLILAAPFAVFVGILNPLMDTTPLFHVGPFSVSGGWISFISIALRFILTVLAALVLVATTGIDAIGAALLRLRVPRILVMQLLFMYRYIHVLLEEFSRTIQAYSLRSFHGEGLRYKVWGSLLGQLLLRTMDRAKRIYQAMLCRGFDGEIRLLRSDTMRFSDWTFILTWSTFFLASRFYNIPHLLGTLFLGGYR
jgi:cobalt/nickel transport system permease protein